jgi:hypothetical protein
MRKRIRKRKEKRDINISLHGSIFAWGIKKEI